MDEKVQQFNFSKIELFSNLYTNRLQEINSVLMTKREIDVITCIISGHSAKKIANFLEISPKTAASHIRNIMNKVGCTSQGKIIDFIESSGKFKFIKQHYTNLLVQKNFEMHLSSLSSFMPKKNLILLVADTTTQQTNLFLIKQLTHHLQRTGMNIKSKIQENCIEILSSLHNDLYREGHIILCIYPEQLKVIDENYSNDFIKLKPAALTYKSYKTLIFVLPDKVNIQEKDCTNSIHYYELIFKILCNIFPQNAVIKSQTKFIEYSTSLNDFALDASSTIKSQINNQNQANNMLLKILIFSIIFLFACVFIFYIKTFMPITSQTDNVLINKIISLNLLSELDKHKKATEAILSQLHSFVVTARLYKFVKPTYEEIQKINTERRKIINQSDSLDILEKKLTNLKISKKVAQIDSALTNEKQKLILAHKSMNAYFFYMKGEYFAANENIDQVLHNLDNILDDIYKKSFKNIAYNLKAKIAACQDDKYLAVTFYEKALDSLNDPLTWNNYGSLLTDLGREEKDHNKLIEGYKCFSKFDISQINPAQRYIIASSKAYNYILLSKVLEKNNAYKLPSAKNLRIQAETLLKESIKLNPNYINSRFFISMLYFDKQNYTEALKEINHALSIKPNHPLSLMQKGYILEKLNNFHEAIKTLQIARNELIINNHLSWIEEIEHKILSITSNKK